MTFKKIFRRTIRNLFVQNIFMVMMGVMIWLIVMGLVFVNLSVISDVNTDSLQTTLKNYSSSLIAIYETSDPQRLNKFLDINSLFIIDKNGNIVRSVPEGFEGINIKNSDFFRLVTSIEYQPSIFKYSSLSDGKLRVHFFSEYNDMYLITDMDDNYFHSSSSYYMSLLKKDGTVLYSPNFFNITKVDPEKFPRFFIRNARFIINKPVSWNSLYIVTSLDITREFIVMMILSAIITCLICWNLVSRKRNMDNLVEFTQEFFSIKDSFDILSLKIKAIDKKLSPSNIDIDFGEVYDTIMEKNFQFHEISSLKETLDITIKEFLKLFENLAASNEEIKASNEELENLYKELEESYNQVESSYRKFSKQLSNIAEKYDDITGNHIDRVAEYALFVSEKMGLPKKVQEDIYYFSPLHDIGKLLVKREILDKPGKLTSAEFEEMKKHTVYTAEILGDDKQLSIAKNIALYHHERFDGKGYPFGLKGADIPIEARVVSICDVYDALRSKRPYKKSFTHEQACEIILCGDEKTSPSQFDPAVLKIFKENHTVFKEIFDRQN